MGGIADRHGDPARSVRSLKSCGGLALRVSNNNACTSCTLALQCMMACLIPLAGPHHVESHQHVEF